jgi:drug/metabolite transporter (DMT)-like permease
MAAGQTGRGQIWFALGLVYLIWGSVYLAIRLVVEELPPLGSMGLRYLVAAVLLGTFLAFRGGWSRFRVTRRELVGLSFMGVVLLAIGNGMTSVGQLQGVPSGVTALLIATVPVWIVVYRAASGDPPPLLGIIGVAMGLGGLAVLVLRDGLGSGGLPLLGVAVILVSSLSWSFGSWIQPRVCLPRDVFVSSTYQLLTAGLVLGGLSLLTGEKLDGPAGPRAWGSLAYLVVIGSIVGFTAYAWLLNHAPIALIATHTYVNPVIAVLLGWLVVAEPITTSIIVGGGIVVLAVVVIVSAERPRSQRADVPE